MKLHQLKEEYKPINMFCLYCFKCNREIVKITSLTVNEQILYCKKLDYLVLCEGCNNLIKVKQDIKN